MDNVGHDWSKFLKVYQNKRERKQMKSERNRGKRKISSRKSRSNLKEIWTYSKLKGRKLWFCSHNGKKMWVESYYFVRTMGKKCEWRKKVRKKYMIPTEKDNAKEEKSMTTTLRRGSSIISSGRRKGWRRWNLLADREDTYERNYVNC